MNYNYEDCNRDLINKVENKRINPLVKKSWSRSLVYGINPDQPGVIVKYSEDELQDIRKQYRDIIKIIRSYSNILLMNTIEQKDIVINLFDRQCSLIHQWGKKDYALKLKKLGFIEGICWKNRFMGTNGPGEAFLLDKTIIIEGYEQYLCNRKTLSQISVPLHDSRGNIFCILDITMPDKQNVIYYYNSLLMICNGVERELKRINFIDTNCIKSQYNKSIEDYAFVNEKFIELTEKYRNRQILYKATFDQNYIGTAFYSKDGYTIIDANEKYIDIMEGISGTRNIIGKSISSFIKKRWKGREKINEFRRHRLKTGTNGELEEVHVPNGNKYSFYNISIEPIKKNDEIVGWVETVSDITKIKEAQEKIRERDKLFIDVLDRFHIPVGILTYPNLKVQYINKYGKELINKLIGYKLTLEEMQGKNVYELSSNKAIQCIIDRIERKEFLDSKQVNLELSDGSIRSFKVSDTPLYESENNIKSIVIAGVDITEELQFLKAKDQFFSIISHELRSPANIIIAASQLLLTNKYRKELKLNAIGHIEKIRINSYRLLRLINNFLDIQKSEAGYLELNEDNFDIVSFSEEMTNSVMHLTDSKGIRVIFDTEFEEKIIALDIEKYERILLNLLSNATKFTPVGGEILVSINKKEDRICLSVKDSGIGIAEKELEKIFEKFTIVDSSLSRVSEGTGLGLNLVKILIEKMNGRIHVKSKVGEGTEFMVCLPDVKLENEDRSILKRTKKEIEHITNIEFSDVN